MQFAFGSGSMWGIDSGANPTPGKFGILQDVGVDFPFSNKPLFGSYQSPVAIGRGTAKPAWKAKFAQLSGRVLNSLFFGQTKATAGAPWPRTRRHDRRRRGHRGERRNFVDDLGVRYSATGLAARARRGRSGGRPVRRARRAWARTRSTSRRTAWC
jgi:hypothetical protein